MSQVPSLRIDATGVLSALQDRGRLRLRRFGIPWAGTLAEPWRQIANALVGNAAECPVIETFEAGLAICAKDGPVRVAATGDLTLSHRLADGRAVRVSAWRSVTLQPGESLRVESTGRFRLGIVAVGGIDVPAQHGSRSSYARAGLGGLDGGPLAIGQCVRAAMATTEADLSLAASDIPASLQLAGEIDPDATLQLRAVPGPQDDAFDDRQHANFFGGTTWTVGAGTDRMGCRLEGRALVHRSPEGADIVSDAIVPGSVQVPGNGQPIVLLNDAHTAGGYPKIATVTSADLMPLALARPGARVRFAAVDADTGVRRARARQATLAGILERLVPVVSIPPVAVLLGRNLIGGVVDALSPRDAHA